jgi:hypothetical protein
MSRERERTTMCKNGINGYRIEEEKNKINVIMENLCIR